MDPIAALRRIAFLLEASAAPSFKVRSFRRAAQSLQALSESDVRSLGAKGQLKTLPYVGDSTERVIIEALAGARPAYLEHLESEQTSGLDEAAAAIIAALRGDCHVHSDWSDGGSPIEEMAGMARDLGHEYMALTDHSPRLTIANGLSPERLREQLDLLDAINARLAPFRILSGIECDILEDGGLDQEPDLLARLDIVVGSVHSKLRMESAPMTARMLAAVANPHLDILGHCTGRIVVGRGRPESTFDAEAVFSACQRFEKAVEINSRPERLDPPDNLLRLAADLGCRFSIDTDAHAPGQLTWLRYGAEKAAAAGLSQERIVNTLGAVDLRGWARSHDE